MRGGRKGGSGNRLNICHNLLDPPSPPSPPPSSKYEKVWNGLWYCLCVGCLCIWIQQTWGALYKNGRSTSGTYTNCLWYQTRPITPFERVKGTEPWVRLEKFWQKFTTLGLTAWGTHLVFKFSGKSQRYHKTGWWIQFQISLLYKTWILLYIKLEGMHWIFIVTQV